MDLSIWLAFSLATIVIVIVPGPTNLVIMTSALQSNRQAGFCIVGAVLAHLVFFSLMALGVHVILAESALLFEVIRWCGVLFLFWLAWAQWRSLKTTQDFSQNFVEKTRLRALAEGFLINGTNPKSLLFYGAFFPPFINQQQSLSFQLAVLGSTFMGIFLVNAGLHLLLAQKLRMVLRQPKWQARQKRFTALSFLVLGLGLAAGK